MPQTSAVRLTSQMAAPAAGVLFAAVFFGDTTWIMPSRITGMCFAMAAIYVHHRTEWASRVGTFVVSLRFAALVMLSVASGLTAYTIWSQSCDPVEIRKRQTAMCEKNKAYARLPRCMPGYYSLEELCSTAQIFQRSAVEGLASTQAFIFFFGVVIVMFNPTTFYVAWRSMRGAGLVVLSLVAVLAAVEALTFVGLDIPTPWRGYIGQPKTPSVQRN